MHSAQCAVGMMPPVTADAPALPAPYRPNPMPPPRSRAVTAADRHIPVGMRVARAASVDIIRQDLRDRGFVACGPAPFGRSRSVLLIQIDAGPPEQPRPG